MAQVKRITGRSLWILVLIQMILIMAGYELIKSHAAGYGRPAEWSVCGILIIIITVITAVLISRLQKRREQAETERENLIARLEESLARIKTLSKLLPVCAGCKRIQDEDGQWEQMETYISRHSETRFSHGMCEECTQRLYPEMWEEIKARREARES